VEAVASALILVTCLVFVAAQREAARDDPSVLVLPRRAGWNLVLVQTEDAAAGTRLKGLNLPMPHPGAAGKWVPVWLEEGSNQLWIREDGRVTSHTVHAGPSLSGLDMRAADGPECASALLGARLAGRPDAPCPADRLSPEDLAALRAIATFVKARGHRTVMLVGDNSARSTAAAEALRAKGLAFGATGPQVVVSGWDSAAAALADIVAGRTRAEGAYLAPWLLSTPLLSPPAGQLIALPYPPDDDSAQRYFAALPHVAPSGSGYTAWGAPVGEVRLYAPATINPLLLNGFHEHTEPDPQDWLPGGRLTAISAPLEID
jgi:hypothetical protein